MRQLRSAQGACVQCKSVLFQTAERSWVSISGVGSGAQSAGNRITPSTVGREKGLLCQRAFFPTSFYSGLVGSLEALANIIYSSIDLHTSKHVACVFLNAATPLYTREFREAFSFETCLCFLQVLCEARASAAAF